MSAIPHKRAECKNCLELNRDTDIFCERCGWDQRVQRTARDIIDTERNNWRRAVDVAVRGRLPLTWAGVLDRLFNWKRLRRHIECSASDDALGRISRLLTVNGQLR